MTNGSEISSLLFWLIGPIGSLIGYGMGKHDNGYTFGGDVGGLALGAMRLASGGRTAFQTEWPSPLVSWVVLAIAAGSLAALESIASQQA